MQICKRKGRNPSNPLKPGEVLDTSGLPAVARPRYGANSASTRAHWQAMTARTLQSSVL